MVAVYLPEEVIREILVRLPVKSLLKFKCVSKSWLSLISSHQFAMAHLNISSNKNDKLIFGNTDIMGLYTSVSELTIDILYSVDTQNPVYYELDCPPFIEIDECRWLVGSCNGLVCLSFTSGDIILWNPATRKFKKLPYSGTRFFDGYCEGTSHGFGYDHVHDDYKVSVFSNPDQVKVYSMRSNSWKVLSNWPGGDASSWPGQFLNGAIHWSVWDQGWFIVAHDVVLDEFVKLPLPNFEYFAAFVNVEIIYGCVGLCCWYEGYIDVWVMKEYGLGESWIKQACIPYASPHFYLPQPFLIIGDGKILIKCGTAIRIYDSTNPQPLQFPRMNTEEAIVTSYFESLVSPNLDEDV